MLNLLNLLNLRLADRDWIMRDADLIADIATFPWLNTLIGFYAAGALVGIDDFPHVTRALHAFLARPAVISGLGVPKPA